MVLRHSKKFTHLHSTQAYDHLANVICGLWSIPDMIHLSTDLDHGSLNLLGLSTKPLTWPLGVLKG